MLVRRSLLLGISMASAVFGLVLSRDGWAQDVRHLCSEKYQAAKAAGTLNGEAWPQFYSKCVAETKANPPAAEAAQPPAPAPVVAAPPPPAPVVAAPAPPPVAAPPPPAPVVAAPAPPAIVAAPAVTPPPVNPLKKPATKTMVPGAAAASSTAVFPTAIAPAHAGEKPGIARRKTCLDQYTANKATNANGGLKWIEKGGGYYSECAKRLKG